MNSFSFLTKTAAGMLLLIFCLNRVEAQQAGVRSHTGGNDQWSAEAYKTDIEAKKYKATKSASNSNAASSLRRVTKSEQKADERAASAAASMRNAEIQSQRHQQLETELTNLIASNAPKIRETLKQHDYNLLLPKTEQYLHQLLTLRVQLDSMSRYSFQQDLGKKEIAHLNAVHLLGLFKNNQSQNALWTHRAYFRNYSLNPIDSAGFLTDSLLTQANRFFHFHRPKGERSVFSEFQDEADYAMADAAYVEFLAKTGKRSWANQMATDMHRFYQPIIQETSWYDFSVGFAFYKSGNKDSGLALLTRAAQFDSFSHFCVVKELGRMMAEEGINPLENAAFNAICLQQQDTRSKNEIPEIRNYFLSRSGNYPLLLDELLLKKNQLFANDSSYFLNDPYSMPALWKQELRLRYKMGQNKEVMQLIQTALAYVEKKNQHKLEEVELQHQKFKETMSRFDLNAYPADRRKNDSLSHLARIHETEKYNAHHIFTTLIHQFMFDEGAWDLIHTLLTSRKNLFADFTEIEALMYAVVEENRAIRYNDWIKAIEEKAGIKMKFAKKPRNF